MFKNRSFGVFLVILGVLVNNYAYLTDIVGDTHNGFIFMGGKGILAACLGLLCIFIGVTTLLRESKSS